MKPEFGILPGIGCETGQTENSILSIPSHESLPDITQAKNIFDTKTREIKILAKDAGLTRFELQSMNY